MGKATRVARTKIIETERVVSQATAATAGQASGGAE